KKELLSRILFDIPNEIIMGEDAAITYSYLCLAKNLVVSRIPLYYYRQRHDSIVKSIENQSKEYYRLGLLINFLKTKLGEILPEKNLNKQITNYLYSQILVRSGGLVLNKKGDIIFNPFLNVKRNAKIVVYSSGSFGQHILSTNTKTNFLKIVRWIDVDFHDLNVGGNKVRPLSSIKNEEFDHLIIATINPTTYSSIKNELGLMGINEQKIVQINTDEAEIGNLLLKLGFKKDFSYTLE
ncbi:MAG: glycosyltransferase family 2 protein, partial [Bacteroidota bacterium]